MLYDLYTIVIKSLQKIHHSDKRLSLN